MLPKIANKLRDSIKKHESYRQFPYKDSKGNLTVGWGRNLIAVGISESEAEIMLNNDIIDATYELYRTFKWAQDLDDARKSVLIELTFNMGIEKLIEFRKMLTALQNHDYNSAAKELLNSLWASQVGNRAQDLSYVLETGNI